MTKEEFLKDVANWSNHRHLLWPALEATKGNVVEFGCGEGSTPYLQRYCIDTKRMFFSFENNFQWAKKCGSTFIRSWEDVTPMNIDVLLIDHAPGERRWIDIEKYKDEAKIIVIHDSEEHGGG